MATVTRRLAALLGASGAGLTDSATASQITQSSLGNDSVGTAELRSDAIAGAGDIPANSVGESELSVDYTAQSVPHIIPDVLYPAVAGNDINGTDIDTSHGSTYTYGELHTDGRKYYYTDIKGSKPIKDPRIGAHFGSQRHKFKSLQLLERETATHGKNVYSVDGREWVRCVDGTLGWNTRYDQHGGSIEVNNGAFDGTDFIEIVGYFNGINISCFTNVDHQNQTSIYLNGSDTSNDLTAETSTATPLQNRYVNAGSVINLNIGTVNTPSINTLKLVIDDSGSAYALFYDVELIAQNTTSTANRSKIQIPSQNVVSYGKKFTVSAEGSSGHHYDPFNGFTNGTSLHSAFVDTDTSLGLDSAPGSSAKWAISSTNHIRPYQGGRVVKWVDSDGTIKTSVNMIPPNAQNFSSSADSEITTPSATNTNYKPAFSDDEIDFQNSEVAKTFLAREMGNGGANGNASYRDATVANSDHNIAYVLDDGLTSLSGEAVSSYNNFAVGSIGAHNSDFDMYFTFIGSGIGYYGKSSQNNIASNLPYGTHVLKIGYDGTNSTIDIDGVQVFSGSANERYYSQYSFNIHQPKRPPIPEDACVIADYMLMADFVPVGAYGGEYISKGVRGQALSRDIFADHHTTIDTFTSAQANSGHPYGMRISMGNSNSATSSRVRLPSFATNFVTRAYQFGTRHDLYIDTTIQSGNQTIENSPSSSPQYDTYAYLTAAQDLGVYNFGFNAKDSQGLNASALEIVTPIHTSHHYQSFETPFLHELVGGDRNMEQTNLICSSDGKTWDQITRDTSYVGKSVFQARRNAGDVPTGGTIYRWNLIRGSSSNTVYMPMYNKEDVAIAYDRIIFLKEGFYSITTLNNSSNNGIALRMTMKINGNTVVEANHDPDSGEPATSNIHAHWNAKRGDYLQLAVNVGTAQGADSVDYRNLISISRI